MPEVYRHYDKRSRLLYVGSSLSTICRLNSHRFVSRWFKKIAYITIERFETLQLALDAEREAIRSEKPLHNKKLVRAARPEKRERRYGGRPRLGNEDKTLAAQKPWEKGTFPMSRASWFRRRQPENVRLNQ